MGVCDALTNLVVHPTSGKIGESAGIRNLACGSQTGGNAHHIGFSNAHLEKSLRKFGLKVLHLKAFQQIGGQANYIWVLPTRFEQALTKAVAGGFGSGGLYVLNIHEWK
jgi:hypothetical protein